MRKSIAQISSQISSDPPDQEPMTGAIIDPNFFLKIQADTRKEWHKKAQGVVSQAKTEAADIVDRYNDAVHVRHPQELNELLTNLHADLQPHNTKLDKLMKEYQKLDLERHTLISDWEKGMEASGNDPKEVVNGMQAKVDGVMIDEKLAMQNFDKAMGKEKKKPRKTDDTVIPSDEE